MAEIFARGVCRKARCKKTAAASAVFETPPGGLLCAMEIVDGAPAQVTLAGRGEGVT